MKRACHVFTAAVIAFFFAACGAEDDDPANPGLIGDPNVLVWGPVPGATVSMGSDLRVPILISANDFFVRPADACGTEPRCGHVRLFIDGDTCNIPGLPYNAMRDRFLPGENVIVADLSHCPAMSRTGTHTVRVGLFNPAGELVPGEGGAPADAEVTFTVVP